MSFCRIWASGCLLLIILCQGSGQEVVNVSDIVCVNGELVDSDNTTAGSCQCYPGWTGPDCSLCRGRVR